MATTDEKIDELAQMVARGFSELRTDMNTEFALVREEMSIMREEMIIKKDLQVMFDRYSVPLRTDQDALASRVKKLEHAVFPK